MRKEKIGSETEQKYALLILLWSKAKNSKRKEAKKIFFSRERAKRMRREIFLGETGALQFQRL